MAWANSYFLTDEWLNSLIHHTRMGIHGLKKWWLHKSIRISRQEYQQNNFSLQLTSTEIQLVLYGAKLEDCKQNKTAD